MTVSYTWFLIVILVGIIGSIGTLIGVLYYFLKEWKSGTLW